MVQKSVVVSEEAPAVYIAIVQWN